VSRGTVFVVDDEAAQRRALTRLLGAHEFGVLAFESAEAFLAKYDPAQAGCLLLDLRMPGASGLELQQELRRRGAELPIVFLTGHADVPTSVYSMKLGAVDVLQKPVDEAQLLEALGRALELDASRRRRAGALDADRARLAALTVREREVLDLVLAGRSNKQVAFALGIAERTVKLHRSRAIAKLGGRSLPEIVRLVERLRADG
jgi:FixJ family two-component response regulator